MNVEISRPIQKMTVFGPQGVSGTVSIAIKLFKQAKQFYLK